jgi:transcriptional regulator with XRE-family HTH domain
MSTTQTVTYDRHALAREMKRRKIGPRKLAPKADMSAQSISYLARGMTEPKASTLARLATALGIDVRAFFVTRN